MTNEKPANPYVASLFTESDGTVVTVVSGPGEYFSKHCAGRDNGANNAKQRIKMLYAAYLQGWLAKH